MTNFNSRSRLDYKILKFLKLTVVNLYVMLYNYQLLMRLTLVHVGHYIATSPYPVNLFINGDIYSLLKLYLKLTSNFIIQHHTWS